MNIIVTDKNNPDPQTIKKAAKIIKEGGVIVFPTSSLYGIGVDALNEKAVEKIFEIKDRPFSKPILLLIKNRNVLSKFVKNIPESAELPIKKFWPGRLTIIFEASDAVPDILTANTGKIGIRLPAHPVALALVQAMENPLTGTSANIAGSPGYSNMKNADKKFCEKFDMIIDTGGLKGGIGSTVIDITGSKPKIVREGAVSTEEIQFFLALYNK